MWPYRHLASQSLQLDAENTHLVSFYHSAFRNAQAQNFLGDATPWFNNTHHGTEIRIQDNRLCRALRKLPATL